MNYLAHLHLADHCQSDIAGNLLGDFIKGDPSGRYPHTVVQGIRLHRFVDSFTDNHPIMKRNKQHFAPHLRRFAPIALDLFWDHCLVNRWTQYSTQPLEMFCLHAEHATTSVSFPVPERYLRVTRAMWRDRWLESYSDIDNVAFALSKIALRSPRMQPLTECGDELKRNYSRLDADFDSLYTDLLKAAQDFCYHSDL